MDLWTLKMAVVVRIIQSTSAAQMREKNWIFLLLDCLQIPKKCNEFYGSPKLQGEAANSTSLHVWEHSTSAKISGDCRLLKQSDQQMNSSVYLK